MIPKEIRVVFIGTPDFAVPSLAAIVDEGYNVVGIITAPDRKAGRGLKLTNSPVKQFGLKHSIPVLQPTNLKDKDFLQELSALHSDIQVVIAFRMLPEGVWNMPPMGTINLHASLLPDYRGAAPINRVVMAGETQTGLTTFKLKHAIDTGNLLLQKEIDILPEDDAGTLHDRMKLEGAALMLDTLNGLLTGKVMEIPQSLADNDKSAPKIYKKDCEIDWTMRGESIINQIRGLSPYPTARFDLEGKVLKVFKATFRQTNLTTSSDILDTDGKTHFTVSCRDGYIDLDEVQLEGKRRMSIAYFLRGYTHS